jgi:hypothetical protein
LTGVGLACCYAGQYSDGTSCKQCLPGADCSIAGGTLATQQLQPGFWRASVTTTDIRECWYTEACNDTSTTRALTARRITDTANTTVAKTDDNRYCTNGYKGPCK